MLTAASVARVPNTIKMMNDEKKFGLLAGVGRLPVECAKIAKENGYQIFTVGLLSNVEKDLQEVSFCYEYINVAKFGKIVQFLKKHGITKVMVLGKVTKEILMSGEHALPDIPMMKLLWSLRSKNHKDDTLMLTFVEALAKEGIEVIDQTIFLKKFMPKAGVLTKRKPTDDERKDMSFGFLMAKEIGRLDVGQTVVVKDQAVMALEAIEGTDACIARGGALARGKAVVVKVAKPNQDMRFDVPAIGLATLQRMKEVDAVAIAIEAEKTLIADYDRVISFANENKMTIVSITE